MSEWPSIPGISCQPDARHSNGRREGNTLFVERFTFDPQKLSLRRDRSVTDPAVIGQVSHGLQRITAITGGKVRGPSMKASSCPSAARTGS